MISKNIFKYIFFTGLIITFISLIITLTVGTYYSYKHPFFYIGVFVYIIGMILTFVGAFKWKD